MGGIGKDVRTGIAGCTFIAPHRVYKIGEAVVVADGTVEKLICAVCSDLFRTRHMLPGSWSRIVAANYVTFAGTTVHWICSICIYTASKWFCKVTCGFCTVSMTCPACFTEFVCEYCDIG